MTRVIKIPSLILFQLAILGGLQVLAFASTLNATEVSQSDLGVVEVDLKNSQSFSTTALAFLVQIGLLLFSNTPQRGELLANPHNNSNRRLGQINFLDNISFKSLDVSFRGLGIQNKRSGRCFDVPGADTTSGLRTDIWDCDEELRDHQKFILKFTEKTMKDESASPRIHRVAPIFNLVAKHSNKCMEVYLGSTDNNASIVQEDCNRGTNQEWYLRWIPPKEAPISFDNLANVNKGVSVDDMVSNQIKALRDFMTNDRGLGYFQVIGVGSGKCLTVSSGDVENGVFLNIYDCDPCGSCVYDCVHECGSTNQLWKFL